MNKHQSLYVWLLAVTLAIVGCATPRNPDGTINACKLTEPPKESYIAAAGHVGRSFTYPDPRKIPTNYSGCVKAWLGDYNPNSKSVLVLSVKFDGGLVSRIETFNPNKNTTIAVCEFDKNESLLTGPSDDCLELLTKSRKYVDGEGLRP